MSADIAKAFNLDVQRGAFVSEVFPGSGSAKAGVKKDDIIIGLNGERVNCFAEQIAIADSDKLRVGDFAVAVGNPFGLGQTATSVIISALGRSGLNLEGLENFIQTDASINRGNSGGALLNLNGELIGINTAILAPGGGSVGIGFAIPTKMARTLAQQLIDFVEINRGQ